MKIVFWTDHFWPHIGGLEIFGMNLIQQCKRKDCSYLVIAEQNPGLSREAELPNGTKLLRYPFRETLKKNDVSFKQQIYESLIEKLQAFQPDLIHVNSWGDSFMFLLGVRVLKIPMLTTIHSPMLPIKGYQSLIRQVVGLSGWVTFVSCALQSEYIKYVPGLEQKSSVLYNGMPLPDVEYQQLTTDPATILCIGRLIEDKGMDVALRAFAELVLSYPKHTLFIAGDGEEREGLERLAQQLGITEQVRFLGWVQPDQVALLMNSVTMVWVPSRWQEPFGLVALQAALLKRPVVASNVGGLPEVVVHDKTGIIVANEDVNGFVAATKKLLQNPSLAIKLGQQGFQRAQELFSNERMTQEYIDNYNKVINQVH